MVKDWPGRHSYQPRQIVRAVLLQMLEAEVSDTIGAEKGALTPDRAAYCSGCHTRTLVTRVGKLKLGVP